MSIVYLSLGSNQGDRAKLLNEAIDLIGERVGKVQALASCIETEPVGFVSMHLFLNTAVRIETSLSPNALLESLQTIEHQLGRTQKSHDGIHYDRTIDIDILLYDHLRIDTPNLKIPHPRMHERDFVMIPLREILLDTQQLHS